MAEAVTIKLDGVSGLFANLDKLAERLQPALAQGVNQALAVVEGSAKMKCPVDTGTLRRSIGVEKATPTARGVEGFVAAKTSYAMYVEFGTGVRGNGSYKYQVPSLNLAYSTSWPGMVAQPYLYPALIENRRNIAKLVAKAVEAALKGKD